MTARLSRRGILLLLGVTFGLTFSVQLLLSDGSSAPQRKAARDVRASVGSAPAAAPKLRLVAAGTVPALREPRRPRKPRRKATAPVRKVVKAAPTVQPEPPTVQPAPIAAPRYIPPRPQPTAKPAAPKQPTPAPAAPAPSGDFDSSGAS